MSAFAGWLGQRYRLNRSVTDYERIANVRNFDGMVVEPLDQGIIALNDTYIEYVDRHFKYRGWGLMWGGLVCALAVFFAITMAFTPTYTADGVERSLTSGESYAIAAIVVMALSVAVFSYWVLMGRDIFRSQYYPVRFNRKSRMVHVFTGGASSAISCPWDEVLFVIGRDKPIGPDEGATYDLRGHIIRDEKIVHTFAVGGDSGPNPGPTLAHWEMIRLYMEEGVEALPFPPLQLYTSTVPTLRNAIIIHVSSAGSALALLSLPLTLPWAISRYMAMKLCRQPRWPRSVQDDCKGGERAAGALRQPSVYARVANKAGEDSMQAYWKKSIALSMELNAPLRERLNAR